MRGVCAQRAVIQTAPGGYSRLKDTTRRAITQIFIATPQGLQLTRAGISVAANIVTAVNN